MNLTPEDFIAAGYCKFSSSGFNRSDFGLQKTVCDVQGKKLYFLTVYAYDWSKYPNLYHYSRWGFEAEVMLYPAALDNGLRVCNSVTSIEVFEEYMQKVYEFCGSIPDIHNN